MGSSVARLYMEKARAFYKELITIAPKEHVSFYGQAVVVRVPLHFGPSTGITEADTEFLDKYFSEYFYHKRSSGFLPTHYIHLSSTVQPIYSAPTLLVFWKSKFLMPTILEMFIGKVFFFNIGYVNSDGENRFIPAFELESDFLLWDTFCTTHRRESQFFSTVYNGICLLNFYNYIKG